MATKTYSPADVTVSFLGNILSGYAKGTFVEASRNEPSYALMMGADGEGVRVKSANKSGKLKLTLLQSAPSNDILSALALADELSASGIGPMIVKDHFGTTLVHASNAWITQPADTKFGEEADSREWEFETDALDIFVGGQL